MVDFPETASIRSTSRFGLCAGDGTVRDVVVVKIAHPLAAGGSIDVEGGGRFRLSTPPS